jgi:hypothetical protein
MDRASFEREYLKEVAWGSRGFGDVDHTRPPKLVLHRLYQERLTALRKTDSARAEELLGVHPKRTRRRSGGLTLIIAGACIVAVSAIVSFATYAHAQEVGGLTIIAWGPALFGFGLVARGILRIVGDSS